MLEYVARDGKTSGNSNYIGVYASYTAGGIGGSYSIGIANDSSYNYSIQDTISSSTGLGLGGSAGITMSFTNAPYAYNMLGDSRNYGFSIGPLTLDLVLFEVAGSTYWGISGCYGIGSEIDFHMSENKTSPKSGTFNLFKWLADVFR